jgi:ring-1,2-phenylacetyl-CoA epoxidase subunit PaaD
VSAPTRSVEHARAVAAAVPDPELPFVTLADLGILRDVAVRAGRVVVTVTPTYSGCPAMREMLTDLRRRLADAGFPDAEIRVALQPAWTTGWITDDGRRKLQAAGIAPPTRSPGPTGPVPVWLGRPAAVACPRCGSRATTELAHFSATACKALYRCADCREPFEYLKEF